MRGGGASRRPRTACVHGSRHRRVGSALYWQIGAGSFALHVERARHTTRVRTRVTRRHAHMHSFLPTYRWDDATAGGGVRSGFLSTETSVNAEVGRGLTRPRCT